ncbi:undecaprenyl-diphosphate phosphatase [Clostridium sp.]|uniref:undecaprenyl-diphosphate phosphatase n=1 Tax=Clostridium sp. TaxID=1506 RepID=UPI00262B15C1|nr:undecaprenyl-diphosphate phosphatase [Clostridium sp.]
MEIMEILKAILLGIVQGITEWLPVSSTGHMILVEEFISFNLSPIFISTFFVVIQFGSILAVLMLFFKKLNPFDPSKSSMEKKETIDLWTKVIIAIIPSGIIGLLFDDKIEEAFFNAKTVSLMLIVYGIAFIIVENRNKSPRFETLESLTYKTAFLIGLFQVLALIPGTSRSGATIIGAILLGTSRFVAAEFSFFLAVPTMLGASALKLMKAGFVFTGFEWMVLLVGSAVAFIVSIFAIKFLMGYIKNHDFKVFGYYRIILGIILIAYFYFVK